jgi:hypothetical protein
VHLSPGPEWEYGLMLDIEAHLRRAGKIEEER